MKEDILAEVYKFYREHEDDEGGMVDTRISKLHIPISHSFYISAHIRDKFGITVSPHTVERWLYEDGFLPSYCYGIPTWYYKKWMMNMARIERRMAFKHIHKQAQKDYGQEA